MISLLVGKVNKNTILTKSGVGYKVFTVDNFNDSEDVTLHISTIVR
jgi:hypothetical protein